MSKTCMFVLTPLVLRQQLVVGDPLQLPPQLASTPLNDGAQGLGKTLFVRLRAAGIMPVMLRTQYRV